MFELIGMQKFAKRMPAELSGGQQTRVALARSLATKPSVMLLDEPFSALDAALRDELRSEVVALLKAAKTTTLMVTHDREEALVSADLVALMRRGQIVQVGSPAEVYRNPISPEIAISTGDVLVLDAAQSSTGEFSFALNQKPRSANSVLGKVIIRPEEINISSNTTAGVLAIIAKIDYYGHDAVIHLSVAGSPDQLIDARVPAPVNFEVGQAVGLEHVGPVRWFPNPT